MVMIIFIQPKHIKKIILNMVGDLSSSEILYPNKIEKIKSGLKIFLSKKINIRVFFAPNHTYDENTFLALKKSGIFQVIDGYGIAPL